jgi:hypothetical protein
MTRAPRRSHASAAGCLLFLLAPLLAARAEAITFNVTTLADSGPGSLRQAVLDANVVTGPDTIVFAVTGTITLTSGEIVITDDLVIGGPGAGTLTVSGNDQSRTLRTYGDIHGVISGLTLTRGRADDGGAVTMGGSMTLLNCVVSDSTAQIGGGGVYLSGNGHVIGSTISGNSAASGGGIYVYGPIAEPGGPIIEATTVSGNTATEFGGGIFFVYSGSLVNSTISGNTANYGGGIELGGSGGAGDIDTIVFMRLTTVTGNVAHVSGGSLHLFSDEGNSLELDHSILANGIPEDVDNSLYVSYTLIEKTSHFIFGPNNLLGVDPLLGPLANNGGPTLTHAPLPGSPVIDAGDPAIPDPPATDQRGFARIYGPAIDLGAVEAQPLDVVAVPTLSEMGTLLLSVLLLATGVWKLRMGERRALR